jgi:hypothetical protein
MRMDALCFSRHDRRDVTPLKALSWFWIAIEATVPPVVAVLLAMPLWRRNQTVLGSIAGTAVIFGTAIGLILREYVQLDRLTKECLDAGAVCWPEPSAFTRFAIYAFIALIEVFALFAISLKYEERMRRRSYSPDWQRW